jgi:RNA polymerase sigma factor for flagellar operon FliA
VGYNPRTSRVITSAFLVGGPNGVTDETLFLSQLPVINDVVAQVCRRHRLSAGEAEDFAAEVRLHFIDRNYEPLGKFKGKCSLRTYLTVLVQNYFYDYRNRLWGKWRPSAEARRLGPSAVLLERLIIRDGWGLEQAIEVLRTNHGIAMDPSLSMLAVKLAQRQPGRQFVSEREADTIESPAPGPDVNIVRAEQDFLAKRALAALDRARQTLDADERLILKMRYDDGISVADIARALGLNQKKLYRTIERILATLRTRFEAEGVSKDETDALLVGGILSAVDRDDEDPGGAAGAAPITRPRTPWPKMR